MVKIKTNLNDTGKNKVTLTDLNTNILNLTAAVKGNSEIMKASVSNIAKIKSSIRSSSSSDKDINDKKNNHSWYYNAAAAAWKSSEVYKQRSNIGSTAIGGLTGISPVLVQKLGIDKAVGSILKSTIGGIKKKWAEAGISKPKNNNINSAVESNQISGTNKRLDKLYALLKDNKVAEVKAEKENKSFLGRIFGFIGSLLVPLLKIAAGTVLLAGIASTIKKIAEKIGVKMDAPTTVRRVGQTAKGLSTGAEAAKNIVRTLTENESAYTKALRSLQKNKEFQKLKPTERAALMSKNGSKVKVSKNLQKLVNEVHSAENILDDGLGTKNAKTAAKIRSAKYVDQVEPLPKNNTPRKAGILQKTKANLKSGTIKTSKNVGSAILSGSAKAIDKIAGPVYVTASGLEIGGDILQGDYREAIRDTAGAAGGWWGAAKGATWGAAKGGIKGGAKGAFIGGVGGGIIGGYGGEKLSRFIADIAMNMTLGAEKAKYAQKEKDEFAQRLADGLANGTESKIYKSAQNDFKRRNDIVRAMRHTEKIPEIMQKYGLTYDEFIDDYVKSSIRGRPEAKRNAAIHNLQLAGAMPITEEGWRVPMTMPGTYLNTDFSSPIEAADQVNSTTEGIAENTKGTNDILKDILHTLEKLTGNDMTTSYPFTPINNTLPANESATQNTSFPNPLLQYMSTRGKM